MQTWLNRVWYGGGRAPGWLLPVTMLYQWAVAARRFLYEKKIFRSLRVACPVIVVGNLTVGGTGKTPLVCWLVQRLLEHGYRPGVVTRGYGGSSGLRLIQASDSAKLVGDEPLLIMRRTAVPVAVGRDRPAAAQLLIQAGCNVIVSDDGLQHYALARDAEIAVVDGTRGLGNGRLLPAGPLREPLQRLAGVDVVVINGGGIAPRSGQVPAAVPPEASALAEFAGPMVPMGVAAALAINLRDSSKTPLPSFAGKDVHALAGIGHPERFFNLLRGFGLSLIVHPFNDHAALQASDLAFADDLPVLMTEKDAVKCSTFAQVNHWYVPIEAQFDAVGSNILMTCVLDKIKSRQCISERGKNG